MPYKATIELTMNRDSLKYVTSEATAEARRIKARDDTTAEVIKVEKVEEAEEEEQ